MKILALDSSGLVASVAVVEDDILIAEYTSDYKKTHSQTLLPMLDEICRLIELDLSSVDAIAAAAGPGSFTGLRIGSATVKGLGLALDKPVIGVPTVDALAYNLYGCGGYVCPLMDARRNQVYTGIYRFEQLGGEFVMRTELSQRAVPVEEAAEAVNSLAAGAGVVFLGDGAPVFRDKLKELVKIPFTFAPAHLNRQRAGAVAVLAQQLYREGKAVPAQDFAPEYLRLSQAERELQEVRAAGRTLSAGRPVSGQNGPCREHL